MEDVPYSSDSTNRKPNPSVKPLQLVRPTSPHGDPASGFSFGKAKPPQSLNLGSRVKQIKSSVPLGDVQHPNKEQNPHISPTVLLPPQAEGAPIATATETPRTEDKGVVNMVNDEFIIPFPLLAATTTKASVQRDKVELSSQERNEAIGKAQEAAHEDAHMKDRMGTVAHESLDSARFTTSNVGGDNTHDVIRSQATIPGLDTGDQEIAPSRPYKKKHSSLGSKTARVSTWTDAEEDAIHMLMFNREKLLQHFDTMLVTNKAQEDKIASLKEIESFLKVQLQDAHQSLEMKNAEIFELQTLKPKLQARVRRFKDYLNGLCDEHAQLKDVGHRVFEIAREARDKHQENMADLDATKRSLYATQEAIKRERESWIEEITSRDHQTKLNEQSRLNLREQLHQAQAVSASELARNEKLETYIEQTKSEHEQLIAILANNHNQLSVNMIQLLEKPSQMPPAIPEIKDITLTLRRCVDLLESLQQKAYLNSGELHQFETSLKEETKHILSSLKFCENQVIENVTVSQQMAKQIGETLAEKVLIEKLYLSEVAQKELEKELQKERQVMLVLEEQAHQSKEACLQTNARQKIKDDEIAMLKDALLKKSNEERLENVARQKIRDDEMVALKAAIIKKSNEESLQNTERQRIRENEIEVLKTSLTEKSKGEGLENMAKQKSKDEEIAKLRLALIKKNEDESLENIARQKAKDDEIARLKMGLVKKIEEQSLQHTAKQNAKDDEIAKLKAALERKYQEENLENIAMHQTKDDEIATLKVALEQARTCNPEPLKPENLDFHYADNAADDDSSQAEEIPRDLTDIMDGSHRGWPRRPLQSWSKTSNSRTVTSETVAGLFPLATDKSSEYRVPHSREMPESSQALTYRHPTQVPEMPEVEDSQPQVSDNRQYDYQNLESQKMSTMIPLSPPNISGPRGDLALDDLTARNTATNALGAKTNTKAPRKRTAVVADLAGPYEPRQSRKTTRSSTRIYGSVIADSQPTPSQPIRPSKITTTNKKGKVSIYQKKFDQYH